MILRGAVEITLSIMILRGTVEIILSIMILRGAVEITYIGGVPIMEEIFSKIEETIFVSPKEPEKEKLWIKGCLLDAVNKIKSSDKGKSSYVLTGHCNSQGNAETDGPIGSSVLCHTLRKLGYDVSILTDPYSAISVVSAAIECPVTIIENSSEVPKEVGFIASVGRPSKLMESRTYKFNDGSDVTNTTFPLDALFESHLRPDDKFDYVTIGIGDRYEEVGAGNYLNKVEEKDIAATTCDAFILAGTSNWGAIALAAALVIASGDKELAENFIEYNKKQKAMLEAMICTNGYDSKTGEHVPMVDGMLFDNEHESVNYSIFNLVKSFFGLQ